MACDKNSKTYAALYSTSSSIQFKAGCSFLETLNLKLGDKVLDMGCGTGELTKNIAERVGYRGEVVGVDPDHARVKFGHENMEVPNASFDVGKSESGFPNDNQAYYDLHFSNHVFHWFDIKIIPSVSYYSSFKVYAESFLAAAYSDVNELGDKALLEEFKKKSIEEE